MSDELLCETLLAHACLNDWRYEDHNRDWGSMRCNPRGLDTWHSCRAECAGSAA